MRKKTLLSGLVQSSVILFCLLNEAQAAPLSPARAHEVALIYRGLMTQILHAPLLPTQSFFYPRQPLTPESIEQGTRELEQMLTRHSLPETVNRIINLERMRRGEVLLAREKYALLMELDRVDQILQILLDDQDHSRQRRWVIPKFLGAMGMIASTAFMRAIPADELSEQQWAWPVFGALVAGGVGLMSHALYQSNHWVPESYTDSRNWREQMIQLAASSATRVRDCIENRLLGTVFLIDSDSFPPIPQYGYLLEWAATRPGMGSLNELYRGLDIGEVVHAPVAPVALGAHADHAVIEIAPVVQGGAGVHPDEDLVQRFLLSFRSFGLTDSQLNSLNQHQFRVVIRALSQEISQQRHSLWSHVATRRLAFMALNRRDSDALYELLRVQFSTLYPLLHPLYVSFYNKAFILAGETNHPELLNLLYHSRRGVGDLLSSMFILEGSTVERVRRVAEQRGYEGILSVLNRTHRRVDMVALMFDPEVEMPDAAAIAAHPQGQILNNAGHDGESLHVMQSTYDVLRTRYRRVLDEVFPASAERFLVLRRIGQKIDELRTADKIDEQTRLSSKALLVRIEAPFDARSAGYDPSHLFLWNTDEKKATTLRFLQVAYVALEDGAAYQQLTGEEMTPADCDDHWVSWIKNALVDSAFAYAIDGGRELDVERVSTSSSCVPGVDHRIIHGLTGIHPDVSIHGGQQQLMNESTWRAQVAARRQASQRESEARFNNSVFDSMVIQWVSQGGCADQDPVGLIQSYKDYVKERARSQFGNEFVSTSDFRTLLETIEEFSERILEKVTEARASRAERIDSYPRAMIRSRASSTVRASSAFMGTSDGVSGTESM